MENGRERGRECVWMWKVKGVWKITNNSQWMENHENILKLDIWMDTLNKLVWTLLQAWCPFFYFGCPIAGNLYNWLLLILVWYTDFIAHRHTMGMDFTRILVILYEMKSHYTIIYIREFDCEFEQWLLLTHINEITERMWETEFVSGQIFVWCNLIDWICRVLTRHKLFYRKSICATMWKMIDVLQSICIVDSLEFVWREWQRAYRRVSGGIGQQFFILNR